MKKNKKSLDIECARNYIKGVEIKKVFLKFFEGGERVFLFYLFLAGCVIFLVIKAIKYGLKKTAQIDREFDVKERMENIKAVDDSAKVVTDYRAKNAEKIKNQKDNQKVIDDFKNEIDEDESDDVDSDD